MNRIFSTRWNNLDIQGLKGKFVNGIYSTADEKEIKLLMKNSSVIEITQAFPEPKVEVPEPTEAEKAVEAMRKRKPKIVVGARLVQEKEQ